MQIDQKKVERAVIDSVSDRIMDDWDWNDAISGELDRRIDAIFESSADEQISNAVESAIMDGFNREYRPVDAFGKQVGEPTTISKELENTIGAYWKVRVDKITGNVSDSSYSTISRAEFIMLKICGEDFGDQLSNQAIHVTAELKEGLRAELRAWTDKTLGDLFNVRTTTDKAEGRRK